MKHYHIWTIGCQMNEADSGRVAAELDALGYAPIDNVQDADVIVLNTCVVRQSAEDRAVGHLWSLKPLKELDPNRVIALMGCMVGIKPNAALRQRFPFVDVFMPPSEPGPLVGHLTGHEVEVEAKGLDDEETEARHLFQDFGSPEAAAMGLVDDFGLPISDFGLEQPNSVKRPESAIPLRFAPGTNVIKLALCKAIFECKKPSLGSIH